MSMIHTALFKSWPLIKMCILNVALGFSSFSMKVCHVGSREDGGSPVVLGEDQRLEHKLFQKSE